MGEALDALDVISAPTEAGADLAVRRTTGTPAQDPPLERAQAVRMVRTSRSTRHTGHDGDPTDHLRGTPEASGNLLLRDSLIEEPKHPPFKGAHDQPRRVRSVNSTSAGRFTTTPSLIRAVACRAPVTTNTVHPI